jgi:DNA polymerase III epsilon subunit-like protein
MLSVVFDTETTGLLKAEANDVSEQPYIIEIGVVKFDEDTLEIVDEFSTLIKPPIVISSEITRITKITNDDLEEQKSFIHHYDELCNIFLGCTNVIGHNLAFDRSMLANELIRIDKLINFPWPPIHICTVESSTPIKGHRLSLDKLYKMATGKEVAGWHRALDDTKSTLEGYKWLKKKGLITKMR